jgi:hypothetical protein
VRFVVGIHGKTGRQNPQSYSQASGRQNRTLGTKRWSVWGFQLKISITDFINSWSVSLAVIDSLILSDAINSNVPRQTFYWLPIHYVVGIGCLSFTKLLQQATSQVIE